MLGFISSPSPLLCAFPRLDPRQAKTKTKVCFPDIDNIPKSAASSRTNTKKNQDSSVEKKQDKSVEKKKQDKSVKFNDKVIAIPIPTRHEYSRRIRSKLWTDSVEMCENTGK